MNFKFFWLMLLLALFFLSCSKDQITAFQNVYLVPMTDDKIVKNQTVLVKGKRIIEIGLSNEITIPENSKLINGSGPYRIEPQVMTGGPLSFPLFIASRHIRI